MSSNGNKPSSLKILQCLGVIILSSSHSQFTPEVDAAERVRRTNLALEFSDNILQNEAKNWVGLGELVIVPQGEVNLPRLNGTEILVLHEIISGLPKVQAVLFAVKNFNGDLSKLYPRTSYPPVAVVPELSQNQIMEHLTRWRGQKIGVVFFPGAILASVFSTSDVKQAEKARTNEELLRTVKVPVEIKKLTVRKISDRVCENSIFKFYTREIITIDGPYTYQPYTLKVEFDFKSAVSEFDIERGRKMSFEGHDPFSHIGHPFMHHGPWDLSFELKPGGVSQMGFTGFSIYVWGSWDFYNSGTEKYVSSNDQGGDAIPGRNEPCKTEVIAQSWASFIEELVLARIPPRGPGIGL